MVTAFADWTVEAARHGSFLFWAFWSVLAALAYTSIRSGIFRFVALLAAIWAGATAMLTVVFATGALA